MNALMISHIVLWALVVGLSLVVFALARQIGVLHDRISPTGALMLAKGLSVGEHAPIVAVIDIEGTARRIGDVREDGKNTLVMFVSPTCPVCKTLLPVLRSSLRSEAAWLDIILASDGDITTHAEFRRAHGLGHMTYVLSPPLGIAYQINRLPYAVLLDEQGVVLARGLINSREHLESLFEAKRLGVASVQEYLESQAKRAV
ncbi:MAG: methylamine dehydrogenase accessory protein MauD [Gammaproteobacteria bacterium]